MENCLQLQDKVILISGGSRGIGKAIAQTLAELGAKVIITYTGVSESSKQNAENTIAEIKNKNGTAIALPLDVTNEEQCKKIIKEIIDKYGEIYGLVNNAGISIDQLSLRYKEDDWDKVVNTNLKGAFLLSKSALRYLIKQKEGSSVVNISSIVGLTGNPGQIAYTSSKAGLLGMTKTLALELSSRKVRVNAIAPGFIETDMTDSLSDEQQEKLKKDIPLGRVGKVAEIAWTCAFLLSPRSSYITKECITVAGGM